MTVRRTVILQYFFVVVHFDSIDLIGVIDFIGRSQFFFFVVVRAYFKK
jgi:hypothetical protein